MNRNIPLFLAFRLFFNTRFYYPVLGVLFLDLGLSMEQYAILNTAWAAAIVALEVPLGAVADRFGRRLMVVIAGALMVVEMGLLAFAPAHGGTLLFLVLLGNRILSGAAEACASGADEALAYDSLAAAGGVDRWPSVLATLMRLQSFAFFGAMLLGAAVYDIHAWDWLAAKLGGALPFTPAQAIRFPLYLTLLMAVGAFLSALAMREPPMERPAGNHPTWRGTIDAARWLAGSGRPLALIVVGVALDAVVRVFMTVNSNYFRMLALPEALFGVLGASFALLGILAAPLARRRAERGNCGVNYAMVAILAVSALLGAALATQVAGPIGLLVMLPLGIGWSFLGFFSSYYLNKETPSAIRATVLSFKGMATNLAYGAAGFLFAAATAEVRRRLGAGAAETVVFGKTLWFLPPLLGVMLVATSPWLLRLFRPVNEAAPANPT